jgi:branched-chain amino acid transport system permease protein
MKKNMPGKVALAALFLLLPPIMTAVGFNYGILVACVAMLYTIAASGLDIDFGYCGQISMGHAAFFAIGAYGSVMLNKYFGLPVFATMLIASVLATIVGAIIAYRPRSWCSLSVAGDHRLRRNRLHAAELNSPGGVTGNAVGLFARASASSALN